MSSQPLNPRLAFRGKNCDTGWRTGISPVESGVLRGARTRFPVMQTPEEHRISQAEMAAIVDRAAERTIRELGDRIDFETLKRMRHRRAASCPFLRMFGR